MKIKKYYATKNACYLTNQTIVPRGIMVHSTGANNPNLSRYVGPDDGLLGPNRHNNHWNIYHPGGKDIGVHPYKANGHGRCATCGGRQVGVHAFIGKLQDGSIACYQLLPWNHRGWHGGGRVSNDTLIGFEICEDGLNDPVYFRKVYDFAVQLCIKLCKDFKLTEADIIDHAEGYKKKISSNHGDVGHWFPRHGKSMHTFREDVKKGLGRTPLVIPPAPPKMFFRVIIDGKQIHALSTFEDARASVRKLVGSGTGMVQRTDGVVMYRHLGIVPPTVRLGSKNQTVKKLKEALTKAGYPCGKIDTNFDSQTQTAVLAFQNMNKLVADGIVGEKTWTELL